MGGYKRIITAGSSKGGTCAIYFGLRLNVHEIYSGACQYKIGTYLNVDKHKDIFYGMMGKGSDIKEQSILDDSMKSCLKDNCKSSSIIKLLYSTKEPTYFEETVFLLDDLKKYNYRIEEQIEDFSNHADVGRFFPQFVIKNICNDL